MLNQLLKDLSENSLSYGALPFWSWNDKLEPEHLRKQIRDMKAAGIGGFFMHARGGLQTDYMGEEWFENIGACIEECNKRGIAMAFTGMRLFHH